MSAHTNARRVRGLRERITYKADTGFDLRVVAGEVVMICHWQYLPDCRTGNRSLQRGRWFVISEHATDEEVVRTFLLAVKLFEEHEAHEWLKLDGERVLNPHPEGERPDNREGAA